MLKKVCACLLIIVFLLASGCARKTMILSEPARARVFVDGKEVCATPCTYRYRTGLKSKSYELLLRKEGYLPVRYEMTSNEVDEGARSSLWTAGLIIPGGSLLWLGTLFTKKLKDSYDFVLHEEGSVVAQRDPVAVVE
ncbi:MAG: hypothetical protein C0623_06345 [Desulfuromonas sp.]|nr:MAG: hypothetical protein C0623_06345 [Desulfuromonas sp.]